MRIWCYVRLLAEAFGPRVGMQSLSSLFNRELLASVYWHLEVVDGVSGLCCCRSSQVRLLLP